MTRTDLLMATMMRRMNGTAFVFTRTARGFDIDVDVANRQWWPVLATTGLSETSGFHIITDEIDSKFTIVEVPRHIEWGADDTPRFVAQSLGGAPRQRGDDEVDLRVSAEPIRRLVRREAEGLGFRESFDRKKLFTMLGVAAGGVVLVTIAIWLVISIGSGS